MNTDQIHLSQAANLFEKAGPLHLAKYHLVIEPLRTQSPQAEITWLHPRTKQIALTHPPKSCKMDSSFAGWMAFALLMGFLRMWRHMVATL
jgi:hypothetical protein